MHRDKSDRYEIHAAPSLAGHKRLGGYLVDAGLINRGQVEVALNDQQATGMKFGEVLATRGWIKQQTIEYFMEKIVLPERKAIPANNQPSHPKTTPPDLGRRGIRHIPDPVPSSTHPMARKKLSQEQPTVRQDYPTFTQQKEQTKKQVRKAPPITKPLPSNTSGTDGVPWVG